MRASLYHYDFTRVSSAWARRIPGAELLPPNCSLAAAAPGCARYWRRERVREYFPAVDLATLREQVIKPQGWPVARAARRPDACDAEARAAPRLLCRLVGAVRRSPWSARLRTFVGFDVRGYFVDGPLITIVAVISAAAMAPALVSRAFARAPVGIDPHP